MAVDGERPGTSPRTGTITSSTINIPVRKCTGSGLASKSGFRVRFKEPKSSKAPYRKLSPDVQPASHPFRYVEIKPPGDLHL